MAVSRIYAWRIICAVFFVRAAQCLSLGGGNPGSVNINLNFNVGGQGKSAQNTALPVKDLVSLIKNLRKAEMGVQNITADPPVKQLQHTVNDLSATGSTAILLGQTSTTECSYSTGTTMAGARYMSVPHGACKIFKPDTEVFLHQTQANLARVGQFERAQVKKCIKNTLFFSSPLTNTYSSGSFGGSSPKVTQIVPVYQFTSLVVCEKAVLQPPSWNGKCGGILALRTGDITVCKSSAISASGKGFRGAPQYVSNTDYVNGYVGESELVGYGVTRQAAGIGSAGGSGNGDGGGYGGAHAARGSAPARGGCTRATAQAPANLLQGDRRHVYFGGSGSASGSHHRRTRNPIRQGAKGGPSGGIVYMELYGQLHIQTSGGVAAEGMKGHDGYLTGASQYMGGGGGGAGGTVFIHQISKGKRVQRDISKIHVNGGAGGRGFVGGGCDKSGKGGSGGKGRIVVA